jgi:two-component system sensor histidine kinase EvgS
MVGGARPVVLVADDDRALRMLCRVNLEIEGYEVMEAATAAEVEIALAEQEVGLVLMDVHLGRDDGVALAASIRERFPELPIAFFTGSVRVSLLEGLADGVIPKPFTLEELGDVARRLAPRSGSPSPP